MLGVTTPGQSFGGFERVGRPPSPCYHKSENLPQQHPPESTILHQFAAKNIKNSGACPHTPLTCVSHSLNTKYQFKEYFTGGPINLFQKSPSTPKIRPTPPPPLKIPGHGYATRNKIHSVNVVLMLLWAQRQWPSNKPILAQRLRPHCWPHCRNKPL